MTDDSTWACDLKALGSLFSPFNISWNEPEGKEGKVALVWSTKCAIEALALQMGAWLSCWYAMEAEFGE